MTGFVQGPIISTVRLNISSSCAREGAGTRALSLKISSPLMRLRFGERAVRTQAARWAATW